MKSLSSSATLNVQRSTPNAQLGLLRAAVTVSTLLFALSAHQLQAQVGNNNPGGVAGIFNGNVTTGCSYDPYTGNAHRTVTDIIVAGAVGEYPLALTRTSNSRNAWGNAFGVPGAWRHNYQWSIQVSARGTAQQDIHYTVDFPDGRSETFNYSTLDPYYRAAPGVRERLEPWTATNGTYGVCYLVLPDGGKVEFLRHAHTYDRPRTAASKLVSI
jgi:hypothetical protein